MKKINIFFLVVGIVVGIVAATLLHLRIITVGPMEKGSLADWLSAIGTILAVITSLYFSRSWNKNYVRFYIDNDMLVINNLSTHEVALKIVKGSWLLEYNSQSLIRLRPVNVTKEKFIQDFDEFGPYTERLDTATIQLKEGIEDGIIKFHDEVRDVYFKVKLKKDDQNNFSIVKQGHMFMRVFY